MIISDGDSTTRATLRCNRVYRSIFPTLKFVYSGLGIGGCSTDVRPSFVNAFSDTRFGATFSLHPFFLINTNVELIFELLFGIMLGLLQRGPGGTIIARKSGGARARGVRNNTSG